MNDPEKDPSTPRNKGGRPKGSKTRPLWVREALKRPRGRPKGSKNKPKTIVGWLKEAMQSPPPPKPQKPPPDPEKSRLGKLAWVGKTAEERAAIARRASLARKEHQKTSAKCPKGYTDDEFAGVKSEARRDVRRIMKLMDQEGILPEDPIAREALESALELMRTANGPFKHQVLRTLLEYRLAKPTAKSDVTVRTAEDFLDELAKLENDEPGDERSAP